MYIDEDIDEVSPTLYNAPAAVLKALDEA